EPRTGLAALAGPARQAHLARRPGLRPPPGTRPPPAIRPARRTRPPPAPRHPAPRALALRPDHRAVAAPGLWAPGNGPWPGRPPSPRRAPPRPAWPGAASQAPPARVTLPPATSKRAPVSTVGTSCATAAVTITCSA